MRVWAWLRVRGDALFAFAVLVAAQIELGVRHPDQNAVGVLRGVVLVACVLPLAWRRRWPLPAMTVTFVLGAVATAVTGDAAPFYAVTTAALVMSYTVGAYARSWSWLAPPVGCLAFWSDDVVAHHGVSEYFASALLVCGPWLAGKALRRQRAQSERLRRLTSELAAEREQAEALAVLAERARIAREMHDVVAHALTIIAVQSDAALAAFRVDAALAAGAVNTIHEVARESLQEMRRVLHVLHEDHDPPVPEPPTMRDIDRLVAQFRSSGVRIEVRVCGSLDDLPAGLDLTAYRIVQEALTNVRKHAGRANATLTVERTDARLVIDIFDDGPAGIAHPADSGYGLSGLHDRVLAHGGQLDAGPLPDDGGWRIHASIPTAGSPSS